MTQPPGHRPGPPARLAVAVAVPAGASDSTAAATAARAQRERTRLGEDAHRVCPSCGTAMVDRGCKLRCTRCGFFLDCSDG